MIDSHVVGVEKPDARIFHLALDACGARREQAVFIGDIYEIDVQGARNAGITPLLLDPLGLYGDVDCDRIDRLGRLLGSASGSRCLKVGRPAHVAAPTASRTTDSARRAPDVRPMP